MARSLQSKGLEELKAFKRRVTRQHSLERISTADRDALIGKVNDLEAYVVKMNEKPDKEGGFPW